MNLDLIAWIPRSRMTAWTIHSVGVSVLLAGCAATYLVLIRPAIIEIRDNQKRQLMMEDLLTRSSSIRADFVKARDELEQKRTRQQAFRERLPGDASEAEFLAQVSRLARSVELSVKEFRPGTVSQRGDYSELEIGLSCEGSYESVCRFLKGLPELPRLSSLTGIEIQTSPEKKTYPIQLNLSAYFVPMISQVAEQP